MSLFEDSAMHSYVKSVCLAVFSKFIHCLKAVLILFLLDMIITLIKIAIQIINADTRKLIAILCGAVLLVN